MALGFSVRDWGQGFERKILEQVVGSEQSEKRCP